MAYPEITYKDFAKTGDDLMNAVYPYQKGATVKLPAGH